MGQHGHAGTFTKNPRVKGKSPLGPSRAFSPIGLTVGRAISTAMTSAQIKERVGVFGDAARFMKSVGFDAIEVHFGHGYGISQFISPLTNKRKDAYGGTLHNRMRFPLEVLDAVRAAWPVHKPMSVRISATDWKEGGTQGEDAVAIARALREHEVDIVDVSAGQTVPDGKPRYGRLFQTPFADRIRHEAGIPTMTVGNISTYEDVNSILAAGRADLCVLARAHLWDPYWTRHAAQAQGQASDWPLPYVAMQGYSPHVSAK